MTGRGAVPSAAPRRKMCRSDPARAVVVVQTVPPPPPPPPPPPLLVSALLLPPPHRQIKRTSTDDPKQNRIVALTPAFVSFSLSPGLSGREGERKKCLMAPA